MTEDEFAAFSRESLANYAREKTKAEGHSEEEGRAIAEKQWNELLPQGHQTPNHHFFGVWTDETRVGHAWIAIRKKERGDLAFIYDIALEPEFRGKGLGKRAMLELETAARGLGARKMGLHVFGHNTAARRLYERLNYHPTNIVMEKSL